MGARKRDPFRANEEGIYENGPLKSHAGFSSRIGEMV